MKKLIAVLLVVVVYAGFAFAGEIGRDGRFIAYDNGTVLDTQTNLMWAAKDNGKDINWQNAKSYCENYRGGGYKDWRMPTQDELAGLYDATKTYRGACGDVHLTELIHLTCAAAWASETRGSDVAYFNFYIGGPNWGTFHGVGHVLPVRSGKVVLMSNAQAQSQTDEQFIAKLNGARYVYRGWTWDIQGNKIILGGTCLQQTEGCANKPLGYWWKIREIALNGRRFSFDVGCGFTKPQDPDAIPDEIRGLVTCKISEDSITCLWCGDKQVTYDRER
jgi:hypothetical protein